ncbi:hypothetical protein ACWTU6_31040 [Mesorhizobium sp. BHbsci]
MPFVAERRVIRSQTEPLFFGRIRLLAQHEAGHTDGNHEHVFGASLTVSVADSKPVNSRRQSRTEALSSEVHSLPALARQLLELVVVYHSPKKRPPLTS